LVISSRPSRCTSAGKSTLPSTLRQGNSTGVWNTMPMSLRGPWIGVPLSAASPCEAGNSPARILSRVDFPQPDGPTMEMNSPSATAKSMSCNATMASAPPP
jgi:hypothetical protein